MIEQLYKLYVNNPSVSIDTRSICPGDLFFALKGPRFDANLLAPEALEKGASVAVVDDPVYAGRANYFLVEDALKALQDLARFHRNKLNIPVIGLTGSNGKTTTKELLHNAMAVKYRVHSTRGNYNNHIGVPLTILSIPVDAEILILEMGTNQPGDISFLCSIGDPNFAVITNIGAAHLEQLLSLEGVYREKTALYNHVAHKGGGLFVNMDDGFLSKYESEEASCLPFRYSGWPTMEFAIMNSDTGALSFSWKRDEHKGGAVSTRLFGAYNMMNVACAWRVADYFHVPDEGVAEAVGEYVPENMRSQILDTEKNRLIVDSYNANPTSMKAAIDSFLSTPAPNKVCILGDMLELGAASEKAHREIAELARKSNVMKFFLVGPRFTEAAGLPQCYTNSEEVKEELIKRPLQNCTVLIKGSRGMKMESLIECL
jgi:UDP-N-acetylmuramoyl-tripeptide--D-alanyl-D-alanine ligase